MLKRTSVTPGDWKGLSLRNSIQGAIELVQRSARVAARDHTMAGGRVARLDAM